MCHHDPDKPGLKRDLKMLASFIDLYCRNNHKDAHRQRVELKNYDIASIAGKELNLCPECSRLLAHAFVKRSVCPMDPKPQCKHCPKHCYAPRYRDMIREVMKSSGRRMALTGRIHYLLHLLF